MLIKCVEIKEYYNLHGEMIFDGYEHKKLNNVKVTIQKHSWTEFGRKWKDMEVIVDGKKYTDVTYCKGDERKLTIYSCVGAG